MLLNRSTLLRDSGGIIVSAIPAATPTKPGSACFPLVGIELSIRDPHTGKKLEGNDVSGVLTIEKPWPGIARTVYNDHQVFLFLVVDHDI